MFETWLKTDLQSLPEVKKLNLLFSQDSGANKIGVEVFDGGIPATLVGNVVASVIRADGSTISINGSKSDNKAWVELTAACYTNVGQISVFLKLVNGSEVATLGGVEGFVFKSR